jgi:hypothetical protein
MTIYPQKRPPNHIARKAWVEFHGKPIPKDETGRSYDIHHIDGNPWNNSKENLAALDIRVHYETHLEQEDWNACLLIARRMKMSPELISELARKGQKKLVDNGTHHLLGGNIQRKQVADGKNALIGGELQRKNNRKRLEDGTHHFKQKDFQKNIQIKRLEEGVHPWQDKEAARERANKRVADGTHPWKDKEKQSQRANKRVEKGTHNLKGGVTCRDKQGNVVQVPKEVYQKQKEVTKDQTQWDFAMINSSEGRKRC